MTWEADKAFDMLHPHSPAAPRPMSKNKRRQSKPRQPEGAEGPKRTHSIVREHIL